MPKPTTEAMRAARIIWPANPWPSVEAIARVIDREQTRLPELIEALEEIYTQKHYRGLEDTASRMGCMQGIARAAIAKATGYPLR